MYLSGKLKSKLKIIFFKICVLDKLCSFNLRSSKFGQSTKFGKNMSWTLNCEADTDINSTWCDDSLLLCNIILLPSVKCYTTLLNTWLVHGMGKAREIYDLLSASNKHSTNQIQNSKSFTMSILQLCGHDEAIIDCFDHVFDTECYLWFPFNKISSKPFL